VIGNAQEDGELIRTVIKALDPVGKQEDGELAFAGSHTICRSGRFGVGIRIRPRRGSASPSALRDLVLWA
jgi:hypothetical protein